MDPFSLTTGVVGLLAIIADVSKTLNDYVVAVQERVESIRSLHQEVLILGTVLGKLKDFLSSPEAKQASLDISSVLDVALNDCFRRLQRIADKLKPKSLGRVGRTVERLRWPFEQDEIQATITNLQRFIQTFSFALQIEGLSILAKSSAQAQAALSSQYDECNQLLQLAKRTPMLRGSLSEIEAKCDAVESLLTSLPQLLDQATEVREIGQHLRMQEEREQARQKAEILEWLVPTASLRKHHETQKRRIENTCGWFLESPLFRNWCNLEFKPHNLLLVGNPGVGKSVMASLVYDELRVIYKSEDVIVLNYYCSHFEDQSQDSAYFSKVLLRHLCQALPRMPSAVVEFYRDTQHDVTDMLWVKEMQNILFRVMATCSDVFLVLDALDELEDVRQRTLILDILDKLQSVNQHLRVMATTRPHFTQVHNYFNEANVFEVSAQQLDLEMFLQQRLTEDHIPDFIDEDFKAEIVTTLCEQSGGSFLLPALQLEQVLQELSKAGARRALRQLSGSLSEAFSASMDRINALPKPRRDLAVRTMIWISAARHPLQMTELQHALAMENNPINFELDDIVPSALIIASCAGLVQLDSDFDTLSFVHFSLDEFLRSEIGLFQDVQNLHQEKIVRTCLSYLLVTGPGIAWKSERDLCLGVGKFAFFRYAAYYWGIHARGLDVSKYSDLALQLFSNTSLLLTISRLRNMDNPYSRAWEKHALSWVYSGAAGISIASAFGLPELVEFLLLLCPDKSAIDKCRNIYGRNPLQDAAGFGHTKVCQILIANGADVMNNHKGKSTALFHAVTTGRLETAQALLNHNHNQLELPCKFGWTALHKASDNGDQAMVNFLLHHQASVHAVDEKKRTPLHLASRRGHLDTIRLLIKSGADVNAAYREGAPLDMTTTAGHFKATEYLISNGASVNARGRDGWYALLRACRRGHVEIVKLLLANGADPTYIDYHKNNSLILACKSGSFNTVRTLLEQRRDTRLTLLSQKDAKHRTALQIAFTAAHFDIYKYLKDIENQLLDGAQSNGNGDLDSSIVLAQAIEERNLHTVASLVQSFPNLLSLVDKSGQLPIHHTFVENTPEIAEYLLDMGASIHSTGFHAWQPLHIAASTGSIEMIDLALRRGADIEATTETGQTPLLKAASSRSTIALSRLLEAGANIRAQNDKQMTCLHVAASKDFIAGVKLLLDPRWGAQDLLFVRDKNKSTARDWANRIGHLEISAFLKVQEKLISNFRSSQESLPSNLRTVSLGSIGSDGSKAYSISNARRGTLERASSSFSHSRSSDLTQELNLLEIDSD